VENTIYLYMYRLYLGSHTIVKIIFENYIDKVFDFIKVLRLILTGPLPEDHNQHEPHGPHGIECSPALSFKVGHFLFLKNSPILL